GICGHALGLISAAPLVGGGLLQLSLAPVSLSLLGPSFSLDADPLCLGLPGSLGALSLDSLCADPVITLPSGQLFGFQAEPGQFSLFSFM
ncbi:hypothetical protein AB2D32_33680, partial [Pseudomonas aeruginosa]